MGCPRYVVYQYKSQIKIFLVDQPLLGSLNLFLHGVGNSSASLMSSLYFPFSRLSNCIGTAYFISYIIRHCVPLGTRSVLFTVCPSAYNAFSGT